jgi:hypothetical protein
VKSERAFVLGAGLFLVGFWGLAACAVTGALTGTTSDCASAQKELTTAQSALGVARSGLAAAEVLGVSGPIALAQAAVNTISGDVTQIQALVNTECVASGAAPAFSARAARSPTITIAKAHTLAAADAKLADAVSAHGK